MAQITPPVGFNLFVLQGMTGKEITWIARVTHALLLPDVRHAAAALVVPGHRHLAAVEDVMGLPAAARRGGSGHRLG